MSESYKVAYNENYAQESFIELVPEAGTGSWMPRAAARRAMKSGKWPRWMTSVKGFNDVIERIDDIIESINDIIESINDITESNDNVIERINDVNDRKNGISEMVNDYWEH